MRSLVYYVAVSIDGFIADPDGGYDAFAVEGDHMSVVLGQYADALPAHAHAAVGIQPPRTLFDTVIMGWNTLQPALLAGVSSPYPHLQQIVASRRAPAVDPAITVTTDPMSTVREAKRQEGLDIWLCGGGELAGALLPQIDRLIIKRNPVLLGAGIPLFGHRHSATMPFALASTRAFDSGVVIEDYESAPAGAQQAGG